MAMVALRGGTGLGAAEAGGGVADFRKGSGKMLTRLLRRKETGKHLHFELKMPYLRLNAPSAALQEVADAPHPQPAILSVVGTSH